MNDEIRAAVGAHQDLGPGYDDAVAEGLVERIGTEIDKRIDKRLGQADGAREATPPAQPAPAAPPPAVPARSRSATHAWVIPLVALGSLTLGVITTAILTSPNRGTGTGEDIALVVVIWVVIMIVNIVYANTHKS